MAGLGAPDSSHDRDSAADTPVADERIAMPEASPTAGPPAAYRSVTHSDCMMRHLSDEHDGGGYDEQ
jgi:hypothetical protein